MDEEGRFIRKDSYSRATGRRTMTWEWDGDGPLVEFWMYGD